MDRIKDSGSFDYGSTPYGITKNLSFLRKTYISATELGVFLPVCRVFVVVSPYTCQKVEEKLANVLKYLYLCGVKMIHRHPFDVKTTKILTIKKIYYYVRNRILHHRDPFLSKPLYRPQDR